MGQLTFGDIIKIYQDLVKTMKMSEVNALPIYIGDDEELNGIHCAYYEQLINSENEDDSYYTELIDKNSSNVKLEGKAILIS